MDENLQANEPMSTGGQAGNNDSKETSQGGPAKPNGTREQIKGGSDERDGSDGQADDERESGLEATFDRFASRVTELAGSPVAFCMALLLVVVWAISGPVFGFSETWQLVINTGTTIITFLMVFLIQQSQNKDSRAVHLKLDELLKLQTNGGDDMIDIEDLSEHQVRHLAEQFRRKKL